MCDREKNVNIFWYNEQMVPGKNIFSVAKFFAYSHSIRGFVWIFFLLLLFVYFVFLVMIIVDDVNGCQIY